MQNNTGKTRKLTGIAIFTAIVIVLQLLGSFIRFGPFSISQAISIGMLIIGAFFIGLARHHR